jgi:hypothetical protein
MKMEMRTKPIKEQQNENADEVCDLIKLATIFVLHRLYLLHHERHPVLQNRSRVRFPLYSYAIRTIRAVERVPESILKSERK